MGKYVKKVICIDTKCAGGITKDKEYFVENTVEYAGNIYYELKNDGDMYVTMLASRFKDIDTLIKCSIYRCPGLIIVDDMKPEVSIVGTYPSGRVITAIKVFGKCNVCNENHEFTIEGTIVDVKTDKERNEE